LNEKQIVHKDINPGNFLFCEKERRLKLTDFYWASTENINTEFVKGINGIYKEDPKAFNTIKKQIKNIDKQVRVEVEESKKILKRLGKPYYDGSAKHKGKTYHPIDIHYYKGNLYHKNIDYEFNNISNNINGDVHSMIDVGCAAGYYLLNLTRKYQMERAIGFEADPNMLAFLKTAKSIFRLSEIELNNNINFDTKIPDVDLVICMNVHMWLEKQFGKKVNVLVSNLIKHSKEMFFQTCHAESSGMYKVSWLKSKDDIQKYLEDLGDKKVTYLDDSKRGGKRFLFKIGDV
jgi:serine/threonine protein kinase